MNTTLRPGLYYVQIWIDCKFQVQMGFHSQDDATRYIACFSDMRSGCRVDTIQFNTATKDKT